VACSVCSERVRFVGFQAIRNVALVAILVYCACLGCSRGGGPLVSEPNASPPQVEVALTSTDWPVWRGPQRNGTSGDAAAILQWGRDQNVLWRVDVPGQGHSSPIVTGDHVYLTTAIEEQQQQWVIAYRRDTGEEVWRALVHQGKLPKKHGKNSHASASAAWDGKRVYVLFIHDDSLFATALNPDGTIVWQEKVGSFQSEHGYGSSPALYNGRLYVNGDSLKDCFIAAVDTETGKVVWRTDRKTTGRHGSYATPVVATLAGKPQVILSGMGSTDAYDPETGALLWTVTGPAEVTACTVAYDDMKVYSSGGYPEKELLAIRADGRGDVTRSHIVWRTAKAVTYVPSPLYHQGRLYVVTDTGVAAALDSETGNILWQQRLQGDFSASPVLVGNFIYVSSEQGKTYVFRASDKFELVAVNDLKEPIFATLAVCGGRIYLRTAKALYCLGAETKAAAAVEPSTGTLRAAAN
jgi:outer membrane protein assembly factor BamB